jgi:3-dehydroquinate synthase
MDTKAQHKPIESIEPSFTVAYNYPVHFVRGSFDVGNPLLRDTFGRLNEDRVHRVAVYVDAGVAATRPGIVDAIRAYFHAHADALELAGVPQVVPGGAAAKTSVELLRDITTTLGNLHLDRQSFVLALGGGSMLDAVGLAVALVHRGLRLVRMPSTVLAQCDAGIGVKNGVDAHGQKNFLGVFAPPFAVVDDLDLLHTLPREHWCGGIAEACKVALIRDAAFFDFLCESAQRLARRDDEAMARTIQRCARIHLAHIATGGDPFEMGSARPLDFGHWAAHRLEILSEHRLGHGQAVSVGIALDCYYAMRKGLLTAADFERVVTLLRTVGLPLYVPELGLRRRDGELLVLRGIEDFREHLGGNLTVTLPDGIGRATEVHHLNPDWVVEGVEELRRRAAAEQGQQG